MLNTSVRLSRGTITAPPKVRWVVGIPCQFFIECTPTTFKQKATINNILIYELYHETVPRDLKSWLPNGMTTGFTNFTMLFQIEDGPVCIVFSFFPKRSI